MIEENITSDESQEDSQTLPDEQELDSSDGKEAVNLKDVLGKTLGKEFPDEETALKAVKDTFSYVGKAGQEVKHLQEELQKAKQSANPDFMHKVESIEKELNDIKFYNENPDYKPYREVIEKFGSNPAEVIKDEGFQQLYEKVSAFDKSESSKSVLQSNPRLAKVTDNISESRKALQEAKKRNAEGDSMGSTQAYNDGKTKAIGAVLDAYEK
jgi:hypothetical protein